jgi:hypothetical protein
METPTGDSPAAPPSASERFCYFVQSHREPAQIARLVATLKRLSPSAHVVVGHDARRVALERRDLPDLPGIDLFAVRGPVERGELSLLAPYFQAIDRLAERGVDYDWLVYLSAQDYPVRSLFESERALTASKRDGYLLWWEAFSPENPWGRKHTGRVRYLFRYRRLADRWAPWLRPLRFVNGWQSLVHLHFTYGPRVGLRARRPPFRDGFVCYAGTQWTTLRRRAVERLVATLRDRPELAAYYERTICSDESLVPTILVNDGGLDLANDSLRYVDMRGSRTGSPRTLGVDDFAELTSGRYQFARKFDPAADAAILDRLDDYLFGREVASAANRNRST